MRRLLAIAAVLPFLVSCGGNGPAAPDGGAVAGVWQGSFRDQGYVTQHLTLFLSQSGRNVTGYATLTEAAVFNGWTVSGQLDGPTLFVTVRSPSGGSQFTITAEVASTLASGTVGGLQAPSLPITLTRIETGNNHLSATVDGSPITCASASLGSGPLGYSISALSLTSTAWIVLDLGIDPQPGTYTLSGVTGTVRAWYYDFLGGAARIGSSGTISILRPSANHFTGTFSFVAPFLGSTSTSGRVITEGTFDVASGEEPTCEVRF